MKLLIEESTLQKLAECERERDELVTALQQISKMYDQDAFTCAEIQREIAETALAKLGADKTGEG